MENTLARELKITQADRDAAADWLACIAADDSAAWQNVKDVREARRDDLLLVQAFARHRTEALQRPAVERVRRVASKCADMAASTPVAGQPDALWWERQSALTDAAVLLNEIAALSTSRAEVLEEAARVADWGAVCAVNSRAWRAFTPETACKAIAERIRNLAKAGQEEGR